MLWRAFDFSRVAMPHCSDDASQLLYVTVLCQVQQRFQYVSQPMILYEDSVEQISALFHKSTKIE